MYLNGVLNLALIWMWPKPNFINLASQDTALNPHPHIVIFLMEYFRFHWDIDLIILSKFWKKYEDWLKNKASFALCFYEWNDCNMGYFIIQIIKN